MTLFSCVLCPCIVPIVLLLDTAVFVRQVLLVSERCFKMVHLHRVHVVLANVVTWSFVDTPNALGLGWVDLEVYEGMHNIIAAVLQSLPTVVLNSALFALGNKPSHSVLFSNTLFVVAAVASFLSMLKSFALMLYLAYKDDSSAMMYACKTMVGMTLAVEHRTLQVVDQAQSLVQQPHNLT